MASGSSDAGTKASTSDAVTALGSASVSSDIGGDGGHKESGEGTLGVSVPTGAFSVLWDHQHRGVTEGELPERVNILVRGPLVR